MVSKNKSETAVNLTQANIAIMQAVLTSAKLNVDWKQVLANPGASRADNAQRGFRDTLRKFELAFVDGTVVYPNDTVPVAPKKRGQPGTNKEASALKKAKLKDDVDKKAESEVKTEVDGLID